MEMKERIIKGARQEFYKYGVRTVTMDDLARSIGVSKRTIYENYKDKKELLHAIVTEQKEEGNAQAKACMEGAENIIQGLAEMFILGVLENSKICEQFYRDLNKYYPEVNDVLNDRDDLRDYKNTRLLLETGISQGVFRENLHLDLTNETLQTLFCVDRNKYPHITSITSKDFLRDVFFAYLVGLSTDKGRAIILIEQNRILAMDLPI